VKLGLPCEDELLGVIDSLSFLKRVYKGEIKDLRGRVLVIGGGDSAIDSARVARRLGADEVMIVYRRTKAEMPAAAEEVSEAEAEGVRFEFLTQPAGLEHHENKLTGLRCLRCRLGKPDSSGRKRPVPISGSDFIIGADWVITALGQKPEMEFKELPCGVFLGGDAAGNPATVINAIASGHRAANEIHQFLTGEVISPEVKTKELEMVPQILTAVRLARVRSRVLPLNSRRGFEEIEAPFSPDEAIQEAKRCLRCGPCEECVLCSGTCPKHHAVLKLPGVVEPIFTRIHGVERSFFEGGFGSEVSIKNEDRTLTITGEVELLIVRVEQELCRGCGRCVETCPHEAISLKAWQRGIEVAQVDMQRCRGCGNCVTVCPSGALVGLISIDSATNVC
ncbi:MAG: 4Fe-4S dicluster domain-containing protein, partial [bacterium]